MTKEEILEKYSKNIEVFGKEFELTEFTKDGGLFWRACDTQDQSYISWGRHGFMLSISILCDFQVKARFSGEEITPRVEYHDYGDTLEEAIEEVKDGLREKLNQYQCDIKNTEGMIRNLQNFLDSVDE